MFVTEEVLFTLGDFNRIRPMIYQRVGIALNDTKMHMVYARLAKRVKALGLKRFSDYLDLLDEDKTAEEWQGFINALTTNLTFFFREAHHFQLLREHAQGRARSSGPYRVWSAAASSGEEAYSIIMTLQPLNILFEVIASDIDSNMLQKAVLGVYELEQVNTLSKMQLFTFFEKGIGHNEGKARVKRAVRQFVTFFQLNLVAPLWPDLGVIDVIFCRNVLIYFDKGTQKAILNRLERYLSPDGLLFLGHSENISYLTERFIPCGQTAYCLAKVTA